MLDEVPAPCPYCGETLTLLVDGSAGDASYIEDCHVCCQPMRVAVSVGGDGTPIHVQVLAEHD